MGGAGAVVAASDAPRTAAGMAGAGDRQRYLLRPTGGLCVAPAARQLPSLANGLSLVRPAAPGSDTPILAPGRADALPPPATRPRFRRDADETRQVPSGGAWRALSASGVHRQCVRWSGRPSPLPTASDLTPSEGSEFADARKFGPWCRADAGADAPRSRHSATRLQPGPGSNATIARAARSVSGPRSRSQTSPWWLTMKVLIPEMP
jgi:hypothetical protein